MTLLDVVYQMVAKKAEWITGDAPAPAFVNQFQFSGRRLAARNGGAAFFRSSRLPDLHAPACVSSLSETGGSPLWGRAVLFQEGRA